MNEYVNITIGMPIEAWVALMDMIWKVVVGTGIAGAAGYGANRYAKGKNGKPVPPAQ